MGSQIYLNIENLSVQYPNGTVAVNKLSLAVSPGEIFALVGPNGAGKSSFLNSIAGLIEPINGCVRCDEHDITGNPLEASKYLILMPDPLGVYTDLTAYQYLEFFSRAFGINKNDIPNVINNVALKLELKPWLEHIVENLSAGWQRRLALGRVLLVNSPVVLLDEPASGLDILARSELLKIIRGLANEGRTIIITSHILNELEQIGDRFGIIQKGSWVPFDDKNVFMSSKDLSKVKQGCWFLKADDPNNILASLKDIVKPAQKAGEWIINVSNTQEANKFLADIMSRGVEIQEFSPYKSNLTDTTLDLLKGKTE